MTLTVDTLTRLRVSAHAVDVMTRRGLDFETVAAAIRRPEVTETEEGGRYVRLVRGPVCVVVALDPVRPVVVTVLLRSGDHWTDEDARRVFAAS